MDSSVPRWQVQSCVPLELGLCLLPHRSCLVGPGELGEGLLLGRSFLGSPSGPPWSCAPTLTAPWDIWWCRLLSRPWAHGEPGPLPEFCFSHKTVITEVLCTGAQNLYILETFFITAKLINLSVQFSHSVVSNSLRPHGLQHAGLPCPSQTLRAYSNSCPSSQ